MAESEHGSDGIAGERPPPVSEEYEAGYAARYCGEPMSVGATGSWQSGWTDASRELGSFEDMFAPTQVSLSFVGTGEDARRRGLPFDSSCSAAWKRAWIETDIALGMSAMSSAG